MKFEKGQLSTDAQIIANALQAIAEEMGYIIQKASSSVTITVSQDLSCSIFDAKLRQLAQPGMFRSTSEFQRELKPRWITSVWKIFVPVT
jgi:hypothetical protein